MSHMAALLKRAMQRTSATAPAASVVTLFEADQPLGSLTDDLLAFVQPQAQASGVELTVAIVPACRAIPAGSLGSVLLNGLRNAIEASALAASGPRTAGLIIEQDETAVHVRIENSTSATPKPVGNRIGLDLSRQIVRELGGEIALLNTPKCTTLRVSVPIGSLRNHD
jgi:signal transduction histidine kinase